MTKKISEYTTKELREICQYSAAARARESKVGLFSRIFSIYLTRLFLYTNLTPPQINAISVTTFFIGTTLFIFNDYWLNIIGALIIFLSIILDGCDGEVARFKKIADNIGAQYIEPTGHDIQYGFGFLIIAWGLYLNGFPPYYLMLGALASVTKLLYRLLEKNYWMSIQKDITHEEVVAIKKSYDKKSVIMRLFYWANKNFFSSTGVFLVLFIAALVYRVDLFLWFFAIGYTLLWAALFLKQLYQISKIRKKNAS